MRVRFSVLQDWLDWLGRINPQEIRLGLERIAAVWQGLQMEKFTQPVIMLAGTNGKGSSVAYLESIYQAAGYRCAVYTSPHLLHYNERIRVAGQNADDDQIMRAFAAIDEARGRIQLTYFECTTLAAFLIFAASEVDVLILEVGLGGRLDAVNLLDADVALITRIGMDHTDWLGDSIEKIAKEKAGILRTNKPCVYSASPIPQALLSAAKAKQVPLYPLGEQFHYSQQNKNWVWQSTTQNISDLPPLYAPGKHQYENASGVLMVLELLQEKLPLTPAALKKGLARARQDGRFQRIQWHCECWLDVAHNLDAVSVLAENLRQQPTEGQRWAIFSALNDKDAAQMTALLNHETDHWLLVASQGERGCDLKSLTDKISPVLSAASLTGMGSVSEALDWLAERVQPEDRVVCFGSFQVVAAALDYIQKMSQKELLTL
ncbi:MAG: bifunctional folylpolyglutamate synthase/dihydrofolate synthase [gamma proteobacterium symbiont of Bathyaustriella thionipta]|nr:bifunctional folylpolyglutamate synthase/dihydrofolate synthase [gamma proteobacterium symbiont of Bathyaustriella thionipta]